MTAPPVSQRRVLRRADDFTPGTPKLKVVQEEIQPFAPTAVLIRAHAVALSYRDANVANGGNPWPVVPNGILCNDAAGEVIALLVRRSWLGADEDGVMADYLIFDESTLCKLPRHFDWIEAAAILCAGVTAWLALNGMTIGQTVLIQGTGDVSVFALKIAAAASLRVILTFLSYTKLQQMKKRYPNLLAINYTAISDWGKEVLRINDGLGVDIVVDNGGAGSLVQSLKCARRGGIVSQVGHLCKQSPSDLQGFFPTIIDRRVNLRGDNNGFKHDMEDFCAAL